MKVRNYGDWKVVKKSFRRTTLGGNEYEVWHKQETRVATFETLREARAFIRRQTGGKLKLTSSESIFLK